MELSKDQVKSSDAVQDWAASLNRGGKRFITLGGYAGTGKTTIIPHLVSGFSKTKGRIQDIAYCSFTGKAASVLKDKVGSIIREYDSVSTIHSLIYKPEYATHPNTGKKVVVGWKKKTCLGQDLIVVDEASMINELIWRDLCSFGIPIIAIGDHGQLPPVGDKFNLMEKPDSTLTKIHRQALENPIIKLSQYARNYGAIPHGKFSSNVFKVKWETPGCQEMFDNIKFENDVIVLCATNASRVALNQRIRKRLGFDKEAPYPSERIICLKNNNQTGIMNGQLGTLVWFTFVAKNIYSMSVKMDMGGEIYSNAVHNYCFGKTSYGDLYEEIYTKENRRKLRRTGFYTMDAFDFGYAISVHRSQGSEWDRVVLIEEKCSMWDDEFYSRWLYTAITRARNRLFVIG